MNAPAEQLTLDAQLVPTGVIVPSSTHIQQSRRKRFSEEAILELAQSIKTSGVINPILVRPYRAQPSDAKGASAKYEIVAGERRYLATQRAGVAHIPCVIRDLDDGQVLEAQLVENLQRTDLNPLEEAEGYAELKTLKGYDAEKIGELIGKSKSYVWARLKLNNLCPEAREAMRGGGIDYSKGLLIARFRSAKLQQKALEYASNEHFSYRSLFDELRNKFMADLREAPFALTHSVDFDFKPHRADSTVSDPGDRRTCGECPHNSANDPELARDLDGAHVCTDRPCFELKVKTFWKARRTEAEARGRTVLSGAEATAAIPVHFGFNAQYIDLDAECTEVTFPETPPKAGAPQVEQDAFDDRRDNWRAPSYRELLGVEAPESILAEGTKGKLVELVPLKDARPLLKAKGITITLPAWMREREREAEAAAGTDRSDESPEDFAKRRAEAERDRQQAEVERTYRKRLFTDVVGKYKTLQRAELEEIADIIGDDLRYCDEGDAALVQTIFPDGFEPLDKLSDGELVRFIAASLLIREIELHQPGQRLPELAKSLKIDAKKIRAAVVRDLKPVSASAPKVETDEPKQKTEPLAAAGTAPKKATGPKKATPPKKPAAKKSPAKKAAKK